MGMHSPVEQFEINDMSEALFTIAGHDIAFTNYALGAVVVLAMAFMFTLLPFMRRSVIPGRWQMLSEIIFNAIKNMMLEAAGPKAKPFLPFIFSIFLFIVMSNLLGLVPGFYTVTSQLAGNLLLAATVIAVVIVTGVVKHGLHFFKLFVPSGVPMILVPLITLIEVVSFFVRPFSLSLRLFANMLAGHVLLKVFAGMTAAVATASIGTAAVGVMPVAMNVIIVGFEVFVALLQAYIFTILSSVYLRDALELH